MARTLDDDTRQAVALFRYGVIADLVNLPPGTPGIGARLRAKAGKDYVIPGTVRTRVAAETMRHWLTLHRQGGFDALYPKHRGDRGRARRMPPDITELLISIKEDNPALSVRAVIDAARKRDLPADLSISPRRPSIACSPAKGSSTRAPKHRPRIAAASPTATPANCG